MYEDDDLGDGDLLLEDEAEAEFNPDGKYNSEELIAFADKLLREDSNRELCRRCKEKDKHGDFLPYGEETGMIESVPQFAGDGEPLLDDEGSQLYLDFPELKCEKGHRWFQGEGQRRDIRGPNPILFESHLYNRKRREIYVEAGTPDPAFTMDRKGRPTQGIYNRCVDVKTEALTPQGWRTYDELSIGDSIWTYDIESDSCDWEPLSDLYVNHEFEGALDVLESHNISARVTFGHCWAVAHEYDKNRRYAVTSQAESEIRHAKFNDRGQFLSLGDHAYLHERHYIPLARSSQKVSPPSNSDDLFELLGWVLTDGTYRKGKTDAVVYQALHNPKTPALQSCLVKNGLRHSPQFVDQNNVGRWAIPTSVGRQLRNITPVKQIQGIQLDRHTDQELRALLKGIIAGDGYTREVEGKRNTQEVFTTKANEAAAIQALCTVLGITSRARLIENPIAFCPVEYAISLKHTTPWAYVRPARQEPEHYEGTVWCPTVPSGFWMARRDGRVYVTGNSHPEGRKTNTDAQRKKNGASWYR